MSKEHVIMSTRSTIWYDKHGGEDGKPSVHLYEEIWGNHIALEVENGDFRMVLHVPHEMIAAILQSETCRVYAEHGTTDPDPEPSATPADSTRLRRGKPNPCMPNGRCT